LSRLHDENRWDRKFRQPGFSLIQTLAADGILAACKVHNVASGITALTKADVDKRLGEGWKMIRTGRGE